MTTNPQPNLPAQVRELAKQIAHRYDIGLFKEGHEEAMVELHAIITPFLSAPAAADASPLPIIHLSETGISNSDKSPFVRLEVVRARVTELEGEAETLHMQAAAVMTATIQNTESTVKDRIGRDNPYWTQCYADVCAAVDREMSLRAELARLRAAPGQEELQTIARETATAFTVNRVPNVSRQIDQLEQMVLEALQRLTRPPSAPAVDEAAVREAINSILSSCAYVAAEGGTGFDHDLALTEIMRALEHYAPSFLRAPGVQAGEDTRRLKDLLARAKSLIADEWAGTSDTSNGMVWLADYNAAMQPRKEDAP